MPVIKFFIDRPILAFVLSLLLVIAGLLALRALPLMEYPSVMPPTVVVRANYPGANPEVIAETVAAPLEKEINGLNGMLYMNSQSTSEGRMKLTVTFDSSVNLEMAQVEIQNRVARAIPRLPQEVQRLGVITQKASPNLLMVVHLISPEQRYDLTHVYNYALLQVKDSLSRLDGVEDVAVWGAGEYSLRVWLDPNQMAARQLVPSDVIDALREQNVQVAAGVLGQSPNGNASFQVAINAKGRLSDKEAFENIIVKTNANGNSVYLKNVARIEMGANQYSLRSLLNNQPAVAIQIFQRHDASAVAVSDAVRETMALLQKDFPQGVEYRIAYDPTLFVRASIDNVIVTLFEATVLVVIVVLLFLQKWRAAIIPLAAIPVSLIGTLALMQVFGFSLNTLSLFGLVLSIGIVVDDAIVVVENVERHLEQGKSPRSAALAAMQEVSGPIIAITSVLAAVFIPTAFLTGLTGQFYGQFALTIAISTVISAINSLTLSPALSANLLSNHSAEKDWLQRSLDFLLGSLFGVFNRFFVRSSNGYVKGISKLLRASGIALFVYAGLMALTFAGFQKIPAGFVPAQDKYYLVGIVQLPSGSSLDRTEAVARRMSEMVMAQPGVENVVVFPGLSINGFVTVPDAAVMFAMLDPFEQRTTPTLSAGAIAGALNQKFAAIDDAFLAIFPPPPVPGLGAVGGFKLQIQDRAGQGYQALYTATQGLIAAANKEGHFGRVFSGFQVNAPQLFLDVDREKAKLQGVALKDLYETFQVYLGSLYVNDFSFLGQTYQVNVQADAPYRQDASDISRLYTRNRQGEMVPVTTLAKVLPDAGPDPVYRYNAYPAADITGAPAVGVSSGEAIKTMERLAREHLPPGFTLEWTELTYQQINEENAALIIFPLAVLFSFLILAALYNSFSLPLAVMSIVPTVLLSALTGVWLSGGDNNIFTQIGFIVLVGLATKNAILMVEFAITREREGADPLQAILDACRLRLRPIVMTSLAFVMGVVPLAIASGAGAEMRQAMGIAVFSGMLGVTLFGLFLTPIFYYLIRRPFLSNKWVEKKEQLHV